MFAKKFVRTAHGLHIHKGMKHPIYIRCEICGKPFMAQRSHAPRRRFCSYECCWEWKSKYWKPKFTVERNEKISKTKTGVLRPDLIGENNPSKRPEVIEEQRKKFKGRCTWREAGWKHNPFYGRKHTKETRELISRKLSGENHPGFGKSRSKNEIEKMMKSEYHQSLYGEKNTRKKPRK